MIEIKELVIRAIVDNSADRSKDTILENSEMPVTNDMIDESIDQMLEILKEKNER